MHFIVYSLNYGIQYSVGGGVAIIGGVILVYTVIDVLIEVGVKERYAGGRKVSVKHGVKAVVALNANTELVADVFLYLVLNIILYVFVGILLNVVVFLGGGVVTRLDLVDVVLNADSYVVGNVLDYNVVNRSHKLFLKLLPVKLRELEAKSRKVAHHIAYVIREVLDKRRAQCLVLFLKKSVAKLHIRVGGVRIAAVRKIVQSFRPYLANVQNLSGLGILPLLLELAGDYEPHSLENLACKLGDIGHTHTLECTEIGT